MAHYPRAYLLFGGVHILYSIPYVILLCTAAYVSYRYSNSTLSFWKSAEGSIYLKGGLIIYLIYIGVLIPRIMIEFIFVGPQGYLFINQAQQGVHLKATISSVAIATDFILMFGAGLLVGRNIKIMERYSKIKHGSELR